MSSKTLTRSTSIWRRRRYIASTPESSTNAQSVTIAILYPGSRECQSMNVFCEVGMGQYGKRGTVCDAKLLVNPVQVDLDGSFGESKPLRYFLVGQTLRHHADDLAFTRGERFNSMRSCLRKFF